MSKFNEPVAMNLMPAEWQSHEATWIAWPHHEPDWPGKLDAIFWVYAEIVRVLALGERVEILCADQNAADSAHHHLDSHMVPRGSYRLHMVPTDRVWLRDSAPTFVTQAGAPVLMNWRFNAWAKYSNHSLDEKVGSHIAEITGIPILRPLQPDGDPLVLEGGAIDCDGIGSLLVTEECLLSDVQQRNPGLTRSGYESVFRKYLGVSRTIWLGKGCVGDDTHGHVDDIARFVQPGVVALAYEEDSSDLNHEGSVDNLRRLQAARDARGEALRVVKIPYPRPVMMMNERLPASYLNFYIGNTHVLVPTFNDPNDRLALNLIAELFPNRVVCGIHAVDLVWGLGTLHCLTQQQPRVNQ